MKLLIIDKELYVTQKGVTTSLRVFLREKRLEKKMTVAAVETTSGLQHPSYLLYERGKNRSILTGLMALEGLGYDLYVWGGQELRGE